jgi:glycosyltransferase involved in cell wall biosynthesis
MEVMNSSPVVSVSCITYNHAPFIRACLDSFLMQQTDFAFEVIIHDDASTDATKEIIEEYTAKHPNIFFPMYQIENQYSQGIRGMMARFNFPRCRGKYIALCEGDDYWTDPLKLQKQVDFLEENEEYSICFTRFKTLVQNTNLIKEDSNTKYFLDNELNIDFNFEIFAKGWHIGTQTLLYRKEMFDLNVVHNYKYFRDVHLFTELLKKGNGSCLNFFGAIYRLHDGGIHSSIDNLEALKTGVLCYKELYYKNKNISALKIKYYNFQNEYFKVLIQKSRYRLAVVNLILFFLKENKWFIFKNGLLYFYENIFAKSKRKLKILLK